MLRHAIAAVALSLLALPLHAQRVIDVNQPLHTTGPYVDAQLGGSFVNGPFLGPLLVQSFKPTAPNVSGGGFFWHQSFANNANGVALPDGVVQITLWGVLPYSGNPTALAMGTGAYFLAPNEGGWVDAFWDPVTVTPGATYFLGIRAVEAYIQLTQGGLIQATGAGPGHASNVYAGGSAFANGGIMDPGGAPPEGFYDFAFRTYTTTPEPTTWALMAAGLLALGVAARLRRAPRLIPPGVS